MVEGTSSSCVMFPLVCPHHCSCPPQLGGKRPLDKSIRTGTLFMERSALDELNWGGGQGLLKH